MTLREVLERAAEELADAQARTDSAGEMTWSLGERPFAALTPDGSAAEFLLDPAVAVAATRTPDAKASPRGAGWVRFRPATLDGHAIDRAKAWFLSAHRGQAAG